MSPTVADGMGKYSVDLEIKKRHCKRQCACGERYSVELRAPAGGIESNIVVIYNGL